MYYTIRLISIKDTYLSVAVTFLTCIMHWFSVPCIFSERTNNDARWKFLQFISSPLFIVSLQGSNFVFEIIYRLNQRRLLIACRKQRILYGA